MTNAQQTQVYITAFVDLLGFSARLLNLRGTGDDAAEIERIRASLKSFRDSVLGYYDQQAKRPGAQMPPGLETADAENWARRRPAPPIIQSFTDTVIVSVPVDILNPVATASALYVLLGACSAASVILLYSHGVAVRGAVSFGPGTKLSEDEVVGVGLVKAHRIEAEEAVFPRVVLDPEILPWVHRVLLGDEVDDSVRQRRARNVMDVMAEHLWPDSDGYVFIDFLGPAVRRLLAPHADEVLVRVDAAILNGTKATAGTDSSRRKARAKWHWLASYAESARNRT